MTKWKKDIDIEDWNWLLEHNLTIRETFNQPPGEWEYFLIPMGGDYRKDILCVRKSQRACLNYARRNYAN